MPRERVGQVYVEWHGDHWDSRFELADGKLTKRHCHPCPARLRGETEEQAKARAKQEAKDEARAAKAIAYRINQRLRTASRSSRPAIVNVPPNKGSGGMTGVGVSAVFARDVMP